MSEAKHTPGPWEHADTFPPGDFVIYSKTAKGRSDSECKRIAYIYSENEDDARLIATAPEMLQVLNAARIMLKNRDQRPDEMKLLDAIKYVVAKAEGRP